MSVTGKKTSVYDLFTICKRLFSRSLFCSTRTLNSKEVFPEALGYHDKKADDEQLNVNKSDIITQGSGIVLEGQRYYAMLETCIWFSSGIQGTNIFDLCQVSHRVLCFTSQCILSSRTWFCFSSFH